MKFNIVERILLPQMIKTAIKQGNLIEMMSVEHIIKKMSFDEDEISKFELKTLDNGNISWNTKTAIDKEITFTKEQIDILNKTINYYDENKLIELSMISLIVKIKDLSEKILINIGIYTILILIIVWLYHSNQKIKKLIVLLKVIIKLSYLLKMERIEFYN